MARFRKLPIREVLSHTIIDDGHFPTDKEFAELGMREGWLDLYKIVEVRDGSHYYYHYPASFKCE